MTSSKRTYVLLGALGVAFAAFLLTFVGSKRSTAAGPVAPPTWASPDLPSTPAGQRLDSLLVVFNGGDEEALRAFVAAHFTPTGPGGSDLAARTRSQLRLYKASRGLSVYEVAESSDYAVTVLVQLRLSQEWKRMTFMVESAPPHRISGVMTVPAEAPATVVAAPRSDGELRQRIDEYVGRLVGADEFSGVVLVAEDGRPLFERAYGMADRERGLPNLVATHFSYASVGKMFTAVAVAQLAEAGELDYDDPIGEYLPEYPAEAGRRVTVDHLLSHRSGIVDFFEDRERFLAVQASPDPQRDYLGLFMEEPLRFAPGERFEYSNSNYVLLGAIVERVAGQPYEAYLRERVFGPAGMSDTGLDAAPEGTVAVGYTRTEGGGQLGAGERHHFTEFQIARGSAAGGGWTTVHDLLRFDRALRTHALLSPEATERALTARAAYGRPGYEYGYGFILRRAGAERVAGHSGGFEGVDAQFDMYLDSGYTIVVLANYEQVAEPVVEYVERLLLSRAGTSGRDAP